MYLKPGHPPGHPLARTVTHQVNAITSTNTQTTWPAPHPALQTTILTTTNNETQQPFCGCRWVPLLGWWFGFGPFAPLPTRGLLPPSDACFCLWAKLASSGCAAPGAGLAVVEKFPTRPLARQGRHCLPLWGFRCAKFPALPGGDSGLSRTVVDGGVRTHTPGGVFVRGGTRQR